MWDYVRLQLRNNYFGLVRESWKIIIATEISENRRARWKNLHEVTLSFDALIGHFAQLQSFFSLRISP